MILVQKIKVHVVGDKEEQDRVYAYLRDGVYNTNLARNLFMSELYMDERLKMLPADKKEMKLLYTRTGRRSKESAYDNNVVLPIGLPVAASLKNEIPKKFSKCCEKGLMYGRVSLPSYRSTYPMPIEPNFVRPMITPSQKFGLYHNYATRDEFLQHLYKKDIEVFIKFANNITFKLDFGTNVKRSMSLRTTIEKIFASEYDVRGSSIAVDGKNIILNLGVDIPEQEFKLDENVCVGVDLGIAIPAMCALNTNDYMKLGIGCKEEFFSQRTKIQHQRKRLQESLRNSNGGHGRKKKMKSLDRFSDREHNFTQTYNHTTSKRVVDFALSHKAKYINLEDLSSYSKQHKSDIVLRNWSYYDLQSKIEYKAKLVGIEVRKIDPAYTSQTCSCCGNCEEGQRVDQSTFICKKCGYKANADFNAARNIAMSTKFVEEKSKSKSNKKGGKKHAVSG